MAVRFVNYTHFLLVAVLSAGCAGNTGESVAERVPTTEQVDEPAAESPAIEPVDYEGLQKFIQDQEGQLVVLDVWSTSCEPCIKELPNLVQFNKDYRDQDVVCATLNIDYTGAAGTTPEDAKAAAVPILEAFDVTVTNLYSTLDDLELFRQPLFQENRVYAIPAIFVFDRSGNVAATFGEGTEEGSPYDLVRKEVTRLLDAGGPDADRGDGA